MSKSKSSSSGPDSIAIPLHKQLFVLLGLLLMYFSPVAATAQQAITVVNHNFEAVACPADSTCIQGGSGAFTESVGIPGWTSIGRSGVYNPQGLTFNASFPTDGLQSGYANVDSSLTQTGLTKIVDGATYTLIVDVGRRFDVCCTTLDFAVSFLGDGVLLATADEDDIAGGTPETGDFGVLTLTFTGSAQTSGQSLGIQLSAFTNQTNWDNVRLTTSIPQTTVVFQPDSSSLHASAIGVDGTGYDVGLDLLQSGQLQLGTVAVGDHISTANRFDPNTGIVEFDRVSVLHDTYWADLQLVATEPTAVLNVIGFGTTYDPWLVGDWTVAYSSELPNDVLTINADGTAFLGPFPGTARVVKGQLEVDLGASNLSGTLEKGGISGGFSHLGQEGMFTATPQDAVDTVLLNNGRFRAEVEWKQSPSGPLTRGHGVPLTDDSGAFYFFDADNWEMLVKVLDGCNFNSNYWVFAAATTDVEYTLTVTDTETSTTRTYFNPLGQPAQAITDTSAFATCP